MKLKLNLHPIFINKPVKDVYDAVYNPKKLSSYFTTGGASAPLDGGTTVTWNFADFPGAFQVKAVASIKNRRIAISWPSISQKEWLTTEFLFKSSGAKRTQVTVREFGWKKSSQKSLDEVVSHAEGWSQMLACMKMYLEHGLKIRSGYFK